MPDLRATAQHRDQELTATRQRLETSTRTAGNPAEQRSPARRPGPGCC
ncbi:hypothetical protein ACFV4M_26910 [Kitasatospora indigofera]